MEKKSSFIAKIWYLIDAKKRWQTVLIMILIVISAGAELIGVSIILPIINLILGQTNTENNVYCRVVMHVFHLKDDTNLIIVLLLITIAVYILKNVYLMWMYGYIYRYAMNVRRGLAMRLMTSYMRQPYSFFVKRKSSDLIRSINEDTGNVYEVVYSICVVVSQAITAGCIIAFLAVTNVLMTFVVVICLAICAGGIVKILRKSITRLGKANNT